MSDRKIAFWFIALLSVLVLVPFLGETIFYSKGEPREAIVAYTMLESGNWILPMNYGVEIAYKPPFLYWTIAVISSVLGGVTEFSARMPSALAFLAMQLVFFSFVAKRKDVKIAFLTSILLLSSFEVHRAAVACRLDMLQVSLIVISLCLLFRWDEKNCKGIPWLAVLLMACAIIELPNTLEIIILLFIYAAEILGEINAYYVTFPYWDTVLHTLNGFLCAAIGFSLLDILNREGKIGFSLSPLYLAIVAFCFSMTVGVIWEFFECTMDQLFLLDMQKDTVVNTIGSVMLDPTGGNHPGVIRNITDVIVVQSDGTQTALGLGGYLDIGLLDTMEDLFVNFIGAFTFSMIGYFYVRSRGKNKFAKRFIPVVNEEPQPKTKNTSAEDAPETEKTKE